MEVTAVHNIFNCSLLTQGIGYAKYPGDGDSRMYQRVVAEKPHVPNICVTRLECIGHVQKGMGTKLRRLMKVKIGMKLYDSKSLECRCLLIQLEVNKLKNYYGLVIRRNVNSLEGMKRVV
jgi:hypothetical protein